MKSKVLSTFSILVFCGIIGTLQNSAKADALWAEINGNELHVRLSDAPDKAGIEPDKVQKSVVTANGQTLTLNQQNDKSYLTATLPPSTNLVGVSNEWYMLDNSEPSDGKYLLHHYAKAARTLKDATKPAQQGAQWYARYGYGQQVTPLSYGKEKPNNPDIPIFARLVKDGHSVAHALVKIYNSKDTSHPQMMMTDASGSISFYMRGKGLCRLQAYWTNPIWEGDDTISYPSEHYSASLTFSIDEEAIQQRLSKTWINVTDEEISKLYVSYISDMSISQDGKRMITYGAITRDGEPVGNRPWHRWNKRLQVWDVKTGKEIWHQSALPFSTWRVFVQPDFKTMFVSTGGGFDVIDIHSLRIIKHLNSSNSSIRLSPDKKIFAVGGATNVQFIDAKSQKIIRTYSHDGYGTRVFWGPDSKTVIMRAGWGKPQAINVAIAKQIHYPRWFYRVRGSNAFAFSPSGKYLAKADGQRIEIWMTPTEADAGEMLNTFATSIDKVRVMQFSPDGKTLAVGGSSKTEVPVQFITLPQVRK